MVASQGLDDDVSRALVEGQPDAHPAGVAVLVHELALELGERVADEHADRLIHQAAGDVGPRADKLADDGEGEQVVPGVEDEALLQALLLGAHGGHLSGP